MLQWNLSHPEEPMCSAGGAFSAVTKTHRPRARPSVLSPSIHPPIPRLASFSNGPVTWDLLFTLNNEQQRVLLCLNCLQLGFKPLRIVLVF